MFAFVFFLLLLLGCPSEGSFSFTPTLENKVFDSSTPEAFAWREKIVSDLSNNLSNNLSNATRRKEKDSIGENEPYVFASWIDGPNCPDYEWETVSGAAVAQTAVVKNALRTITLNGKAFIESLSLVNLTLGMSLFVVYNDTVIYDNSFGVKDANTMIPPNFDTIYDIGSVTKIFTSSLFFKAQGDGYLNSDDDLTQFFNDDNPPSWQVRNPYKSTLEAQEGKAGVSLQALAGQVSGMAREAPCGVYCPHAFGETENFLYLNRYYSVQFPPFSRSLYSNLGFTLLGRATERALSLKYEDAVVSKILLPLGMNSSGFEFTQEIQDRMATGYTTTSLGPLYNQEVSQYNTQQMNFAAPAGGMYSSPRDLATFLSYLFRSEPKGSNVGGLDSLWEFLSPGENENDGLTGYGLMGWETAYDLGRLVRTKGGLVDGFATSIAFDPNLKLGVGALINFPDGGGMDEMTASMMATLIPTVTQAVQSLQPVKPLSPNYQNYLGSYLGIVIIEEGSHLGEGYLDGRISFMASPMVFWWDEELDYIENGMTFNAYRFKPTEYVPLQSSCLAISGVGADSVVWFSSSGGTSFLTYPDTHLFLLPKSSNSTTAK